MSNDDVMMYLLLSFLLLQSFLCFRLSLLFSLLFPCLRYNEGLPLLFLFSLPSKGLCSLLFVFSLPPEGLRSLLFFSSAEGLRSLLFVLPLSKGLCSLLFFFLSEGLFFPSEFSLFLFFLLKSTSEMVVSERAALYHHDANR